MPPFPPKYGGKSTRTLLEPDALLLFALPLLFTLAKFVAETAFIQASPRREILCRIRLSPRRHFLSNLIS